jgi:hypothetical protein
MACRESVGHGVKEVENVLLAAALLDGWPNAGRASRSTTLVPGCEAVCPRRTPVPGFLIVGLLIVYRYPRVD